MHMVVGSFQEYGKRTHCVGLVSCLFSGPHFRSSQCSDQSCTAVLPNEEQFENLTILGELYLPLMTGTKSQRDEKVKHLQNINIWIVF
jgi:hypothetical protein